MKPPVANILRAREAWQGNPPDWIVVLAEQCDLAQSQASVGRAIGYSASVVNQVLGNRYAGKIETVEAKVRGVYMAATVECPVLGEISTAACLDHQARELAATNPQRVRLYRACRTCPNNRKAGKTSSAKGSGRQSGIRRTR